MSDFAMDFCPVAMGLNPFSLIFAFRAVFPNRSSGNLELRNQLSLAAHLIHLICSNPMNRHCPARTRPGLEVNVRRALYFWRRLYIMSPKVHNLGTRANILEKLDLLVVNHAAFHL
jgi:hypothetical protein